MAYDPLFLEAPPSPALCAEWGIPAGAELLYLRFPSARWPVYDRRLEGYQAVFLRSLDPDAEGHLPDTWAPGFEPHRFRLARIRFREDRAYGEMRPPRGADDLPLVHVIPALEGLRPIATDAEMLRAWHGVAEFLFDLVAERGRVSDDVQTPTLASERKTTILNGILDRLYRGYRLHEITRLRVAGDIHVPLRTLGYWQRHYGWRWHALKREALQLYQSSPQ